MIFRGNIKCRLKIKTFLDLNVSYLCLHLSLPLVFSFLRDIFCRSHSYFCASNRPACYQRNHRCSRMQCYTWLQSQHQVPAGYQSVYLYMYMHTSSLNPMDTMFLWVSNWIKNRLHMFCPCRSFRWDRSGTAVLPSSGGRVSVRQGSLTIGQTWSGDIGDYTCTVTSPAGNDSRTARLEVM